MTTEKAPAEKPAPNFRLTTDKDVLIVSNYIQEHTCLSVNVSLHPKDIESLLELISDFLLQKCQLTNQLNQIHQNEYIQVKKFLAEENEKPAPANQ